jgi:hypothetical protein
LIEHKKSPTGSGIFFACDFLILLYFTTFPVDKKNRPKQAAKREERSLIQWINGLSAPTAGQ